MKHRHTRTTVTAIATLSLALGATIIGAGSAHATASTYWDCTALSPTYTTSEVDGSHCQGYGGSAGFLAQNGTTEYTCTSFHRIQVSSIPLGNYWDVTANGCTVLLA